MAKKKDLIEHEGFVEYIQNNRVFVRIVQNAACAGCHAKGACMASDKTEKIIETEAMEPNLQVGEKVMVTVQRKLGMKAAVLAFVIPFMLILLSLAVLDFFISNEAITGTISLAILIPYYTILYLCNGKFQKEFQFYCKRA